MKKLIIVESPNKIKKIKSFVGNDYIVMATCGHFLELNDGKGMFGIDVKNNFEPFYKIDKNKKDRIKQIVDVSKTCDEVFVCTDNDREGEAIGAHIAKLINAPSKIKRGIFNEITQKAVVNAISNPTEINENKVNAQKARQIIDKIVGYKVSPLLWNNIVSKKSLSAGRVQSIGLKIIADRQRLIDKFSKLKYYTIHAKLSNSKGEEFEAQMSIKDKLSLTSENKAKNLVEYFKDKDFIVSDIIVKQEKRFPLSVFTTSLLQQSAFSLLGFDNDKTMKVAQKLYEEGLITYHRSDSAKISQDALAETRKLIKSNFGNEYLPNKPHFFKSAKGAQEAHECIRPTNVIDAIEMANKITQKQTGYTGDQDRLLQLVSKRFVASQIEQAIFEKISVDIKVDKALFSVGGQKLVFDGYLKIWDYYEVEEKQLPELQKGEKLNVLDIFYQGHETKPPPRFNSASLVKELEKNEVGRPSTYASILTTLLKREYIKKEGKAFEPTQIGMLVEEFLTKFFGENIMDIKYTADMEELLDKIESGNSDWVDVLRQMYNDLLDKIGKVKKSEDTNKLCKCGKKILLKYGRWGKFPACEDKECDIKYAFDEGGAVILKPKKEYLPDPCPKCGKKLIKRKSKKDGTIFYGCEGFPNCKQLADADGNFIKKKTAKKLKEKCPKCKKELVLRNGPTGKFVGCSGYPKCRYTGSYDK